jgi:hypothetical protein
MLLLIPNSSRKVGSKMRIPKFFDNLHQLDERDYWSVGLTGNPAYSGLHRGEDVEVSISREALERKVKDSVAQFFSAQTDDEKPKHLYLFSREGGAGKSHTQRQVRKHCWENDIAFVEIWHEDWHEGNVPENLPYLMNLMGADRIVAFLECDHPWELYEQLCNIEGVFIIGSGHEPNRELRKVIERFEVLDLERDYPLSSTQLLDLLRQTMEKMTTVEEQIIGGHVLEEISKNTHSPGEALNVLGVCLAIYAYKAKKGEKYEVTVKDARQWTYRNMPKD